MNRNELQGIAAHILAKDKRLLCQWATGTGKSGVVIRFLSDNPGLTCLILVPEQNNIQNWIAEFEKFNISTDNVVICCYASFHKWQNTKWDLLVFDEAPHVDTDKRKAICDSVRGEYVLALGAVIDDEETQALESAYGTFHKSHVPLKKAIEWGILPSPMVYVLHMQLDNMERRHWVNGTQLTERGYYNWLKGKVDNAVTAFNSNPNPFTKQKMLRAGNERKRFLGAVKREAIKKICLFLQNKGKRFLCFCSSIEQAHALGGDKAFTSKTPKGMSVLEKFNTHQIDSLFVVGKLIEGQNLNDINCGVIGQLGGTSRITVQEIGRIMRSENPVIYIPVFDDTKDDGFLYTVTANIPQEYIKHYNF